MSNIDIVPKPGLDGLKDQIRRMLENDTEYLVEHYKVSEVHEIMDYILSRKILYADLSLAFRMGYSGWDDLLLSEECYHGKIKKIFHDQNMEVFNEITDKFLANYAITSLVDGESIIAHSLSHLLPIEGMTEEEEHNMDYERERICVN